MLLAQSEGRTVQDRNWFYSFIKKYVSLKNHVSIEKNWIHFSVLLKEEPYIENVYAQPNSGT